MLKFRNKKGFTLVELLIVISIIGFLVSMAMYAFNSAKMESRDAQRLAGLRAIEKALELYYDNNNNTYPIIIATNWNTSLTTPCSSIWCKEGYASTVWTLERYLEPYLPQLPREPLLGQNSYRYFYKSLDGKSYGLSTALESKKNDYLETGDGGSQINWYEIGDLVKICLDAGKAWPSGAVTSCP